MIVPLWLGILVFVAFGFVAVVLMPLLIIASQRAQLARAFPVTGSKFGLRLASPAPFTHGIGVDEYLELLVAAWSSRRGVPRSRLLAKLGGLMVTWMPNDPDIKHPRSVRDAFGRVVAGWHDGNRIVVVYRVDDRLCDTAFGHEIGHELLELDDLLADPDHGDAEAWAIVADVDDETRAMP